MVPINWYRGDYVYSDDVVSFPQTNFGLIAVGAGGVRG